MKKAIRIILIAVAAIFCCVSSAHAADSYFELNGFSFSINSENEATIHDYDGSSTDVVIPYALLRAPVVYIDEYAFYQQQMTSLDLQKATGLVNIGSSAFSDCSSLEELHLPSNVALSSGAFESCTGLQTLTIDEGIDTIPEQCFYQCSSLTEITLPDSVTTIETRAFDSCTGLRYAYLSNNVSSIAENAFSGDSDLTIRCEYGSYAVQYAKDHNINVEYLYRYLLGDADGDEDISVIDATVILRVLANIMDDPNGSITLRGRVTGDEELSGLDATCILRYLADIKTPYPVGEEAEGYTADESLFS